MVSQNKISLCSEFHGSLQSIQVVKAEGSQMKKKSLGIVKRTKYWKQSMNEDIQVLTAFKLTSTTQESNRNVLNSHQPSSWTGFPWFSLKCEQKESKKDLADQV